MFSAISRRLDPWTLAIVAAGWASLSAGSFLSSTGSLAHRSIYAWAAAFGLSGPLVGALMIVNALLLLVTLSPRADVPVRSMICLTSAILWLEFGCRTLAAGLAMGDFLPRSSLADIACGLCLALAAIEWPFCFAVEFFGDTFDE